MRKGVLEIDGYRNILTIQELCFPWSVDSSRFPLCQNSGWFRQYRDVTLYNTEAILKGVLSFSNCFPLIIIREKTDIYASITHTHTFCVYGMCCAYIFTYVWADGCSVYVCVCVCMFIHNVSMYMETPNGQWASLITFYSVYKMGSFT